ncbi:MAG TPA: transglutaminase-like domain-containing protein, partial [Bacillota bacterium]|nr:transglutaminase-like domain-containing protein [Bacillota bacterium]
ENITGIKYKVVAQKSFKAEMTELNSVYLQSTQPIVWNYDMESIKLANSLAQGEKDSLKVVQAIYDYIVNNISYDYKKADKLSSDYTPEIDTIIRDGKGIC